ncbi:MAG TPA: VOC family protein [Candidatus Dormibacteraeota bacterium]|jgi:catechol 2,3-dioxygenase-like lactoylglutathione lyase family enzyme|nr:VOC family protein [Candidatus Dormibacteraeota bacterium]
MLGLLELVLEVEDVDRSLGFYRGLLGMPELVRWGEPRPAAWVRMGPGQALGLWPARTGGPGVANGGARGGAHVHLAFRIEEGSIEVWAERLRRAGYAVEGPLASEVGVAIFVADPDGHVVELEEWHAPTS